MLYIFRMLKAPFLKAGFTNSCPYERSRRFWTVKHPAELCGKLAFEDSELVAVFQGDMSGEKLLQEAFPDRSGEFWDMDKLDAMLAYMREKFIELPLPERLDIAAEEAIEKLPCCGAPSLICFQCGKAFPRWIKLKQHLDDVHRNAKVRCPCGSFQIERNLKRHQATKGCKQALGKA